MTISSFVILIVGGVPFTAPAPHPPSAPPATMRALDEGSSPADFKLTAPAHTGAICYIVTSSISAFTQLWYPSCNHVGPECYVRPPVKTNKKLIRNALCYVCLAGEANISTKQRALAVS